MKKKLSSLWDFFLSLCKGELEMPTARRDRKYSSPQRLVNMMQSHGCADTGYERMREGTVHTLPHIRKRCGTPSALLTGRLLSKHSDKTGYQNLLGRAYLTG